MRRLLAFLAVITLAAIPVSAQVGQFAGLDVVGPTHGQSTAADDNVAIWVKYIGTDRETPTIQVSSAGDIQFELDGTVDATVSCPEADGDGVIDVSDGSCDTFLEVVNAINQAGSNWRAALGSVLATDTSTDALATLSETDTDLTKGLGLFYDTNFAGSEPTVSALLLPPNVVQTGGEAGAWFFSGAGVNANPFARMFTLFTYFSETKTSAGTLTALNIYGVHREYKGNATVGYDLAETSRLAWTETAGATTVNNTTDFSNFPLVSREGEAFLIRYGSDTTISAQTLVGAGVFAK